MKKPPEWVMVDWPNCQTGDYTEQKAWAWRNSSILAKIWWLWNQTLGLIFNLENTKLTFYYQLLKPKNGYK